MVFSIKIYVTRIILQVTKFYYTSGLKFNKVDLEINLEERSDCLFYPRLNLNQESIKKLKLELIILSQIAKAIKRLKMF